jgi:hypothetical protein
MTLTAKALMTERNKSNTYPLNFLSLKLAASNLMENI